MAWRIGVDGGATKTECILVDPSGAIAGRHIAPGCNPSVVGEERAALLLREALRALRSGREAEAVSATLICMAGNRAFWKEFAAGLAGFGRTSAADDSLPVLELATRGGPGLVLHAGTGSFVAARTGDGAVHYAGGLGWRFGDEGSGYDLGSRAIASALLEIQGWAPKSGLGALVRERTGLSDAGPISRYFNSQTSPNIEIAALAPRVLALAESGDHAARTAVAESVRSLLNLAIDVTAKLFPYAPAPATGTARPVRLITGVSGPILNHPASFRVLAGHTDFDLKPVLEPPIEGVRLLLAREFPDS